MAYSRGSSANIIVGAAALFTYDNGTLTDADLPDVVEDLTYKDTLQDDLGFRNVGYTMNGLEVQFQPDFGEVQVDQLLDVARLYKQGMQVNMVTAFAEGTLENLLVATAAADADLTGSGTDEETLVLQSGNLGEVPLERAMIAVGPGSGDPDATGANKVERVYVAHRALSIESVTASAKR